MNKYGVYLLAATSLLSVTIGICYLSGFWFSFHFLGSEVGSESGTIGIFASVSIGLGIVLLATLPLRNDKQEARFYRILRAAFLSILFLINIPAFFLWIGFGFIISFSEGIKGLIPHVMILAIIIMYVMNSANTKYSDLTR